MKDNHPEIAAGLDQGRALLEIVPELPPLEKLRRALVDFALGSLGKIARDLEIPAGSTSLKITTTLQHSSTGRTLDVEIGVITRGGVLYARTRVDGAPWAWAEMDADDKEVAAWFVGLRQSAIVEGGRRLRWGSLNAGGAS